MVDATAAGVLSTSFPTDSGARTVLQAVRGLGLAICRKIMRNLDSRITVESSTGKGTVFSLWFPLEVHE
jgi:signal transduction histidine kinase